MPQTLHKGRQSRATPVTLAIVGRPNVGKSTLFNRIVGRRRAIVGDEPGITRDRLYGETVWNGQALRAIDTGGILPDEKEEIPREIFRQAQQALAEAEAIVMVVDGRSQLTAPDMELARLLQRAGKPLFLAVNKMDSTKQYAEAEEFRRLGIAEMLPISAEHGTGVAELLDAILVSLTAEGAESAEGEEIADTGRVEPAQPRTHSTRRAAPSLRAGPKAAPHEHDPVPDPGQERQDAAPAADETKIAIIGRPNVGKSTLLNLLTHSSRAIVSAIPGTTRDAVDEVIEHGGRRLRFIDTAGIRRKGKTKLMAEKLSVVMARKHLEAADIALLVVDASEGVTAGDATIAGYAHESGRSVMVIVNKWDLVTSARADGRPPADRNVFEQQARRALKFVSYAPMIFISALEGRGTERIFSLVETVARERRKRISTAEMNRFLKRIDFERASAPAARQVRIYYMTQAAVAPPTFVLFTDRKVKLHFSYQRFLENQIRREFGFQGTPIWIKARAKQER